MFLPQVLVRSWLHALGLLWGARKWKKTIARTMRIEAQGHRSPSRRGVWCRRSRGTCLRESAARRILLLPRQGDSVYLVT